MTENSSVKKVIDLPIDDILPNRYQPRIKFDDTSIYELSESIKNHGVFQPILVRPIGDKYEIIAGERRYKASVLANKTTIPAIIMSLNDKDTVEVALIENVQRSNLTPIEEAISYKKILDMGYIKQEDLARKLGKTQSTIANKLRLLNLDEDIQEALLDNKISERHARSLLRLKDTDDQKIMLKRIINERLTVRKTDEEIDKMINDNPNNFMNNNPITIDISNENNGSENMVINPMVEEVIPEISAEPVQQPTSNPIFGFTSNAENDNNTRLEGTNASTVISSDPIEKVEPIDVVQTDVNAIQNNAMPVYEEKPLANMSDLLKSQEDINNEIFNNGEKPQKTINNRPNDDSTEEGASDILKPGKFFNFSMDEPKEPVEEKKNDNSGFNFNNFVTPTETKPFEFNTNAEVPTEVKPVESSNSTANPFNEFFTSTPVQTNPVEDPDDIVIPTVNPTPIVNTEIAPSVVSEPTITIPNFNQPEPVIPNFNEQPQAPNVMAAVNVIREAVTKLENMGFKVDVDEIDLESIYQLIIKIDK